MQTETRSIPFKPVDGEPNKLVGYGAVWNSEAKIPVSADQYFTEVIRPGALRWTDCRFLYQHDEGRPLGRTVSGTLALAEDDHGLRFACELPDIPLSAEIKTLVKRGDLDGASVRMVDIKSKWTQRNGIPHREIVSAIVPEISLVTFPAYLSTSVDLRSVSFETCELEVLRKRLNLLAGR